MMQQSKLWDFGDNVGCATIYISISKDEHCYKISSAMAVFRNNCGYVKRTL